MPKKLYFVRWYCKFAIYLPDRKHVTKDRIYHGECEPNFLMLKSLGFDPVHFFEIPCHDLDKIPEFTTTTKSGHWDPPESFYVLVDQINAYRKRKHNQAVLDMKSQYEKLITTPFEDLKP